MIIGTLALRSIEARRRPALLLTGHAIGEEAIIYPTVAMIDEEGHSTKACIEQSAAKLPMGLLEDLEPMSREYLDNLEHIRRAVADREDAAFAETPSGAEEASSSAESAR
jgi:hemerythrin superfamily protein